MLLVSILSGFAIAFLGKTGEPIAHAIDQAAKIFFGIIRIIVRVAPIGAFGAMAFTIGAYGLGALWKLVALIGTFYLTSILFVLIVLGTIARLSGFSILRFIAYIKDELLIVLGTSSSETVLPQMMQKMEHLGASRSVVGLVVPTGYSFNLDGTNIYMTLATLFLAQATNTHLTIWQELGILGIAMITSKGASGVTGAGFITLAATLSIVPDIPIQSIAILVGIDKFMSECRALTNLIGNGVACIVISRSEGELDKDKLHETMAHPIEIGEALEPGGGRRSWQEEAAGDETNGHTIYGIKNCDTMKKARAWLDVKASPTTFTTTRPQVSRRTAEGLERQARLGDAAQPRRHHLQETARHRQGRPEREEGAGADAGATLDDQAAGARIGSKLLVGFKPEIYAKEVGSRRAEMPSPVRSRRRLHAGPRACGDFAVDHGVDDAHRDAPGLQAIRFLTLKPPSTLIALKEPTICSTRSPKPNGSSSRS